ncbi:MAG: response regulator transcription factor [Candidatus Omnitrophota bacterium]
MAKAQILIVEDEKDIVEMIEYNLHKEGYKTSSVFNGQDGVSLAEKQAPDLMILDLMLPDIDGFEVCKQIKQHEKTANIPIIMLTAKSQESDKIVGLELGADDYMTKPFSPRELLARIKAVLRRKENFSAYQEQKQELKHGIISISIIKHKVFIAGKEIMLTHAEFKLLECMVRRPGIVFTREVLLNSVFGYDSASYDRTIDAHIKSLRKKLGEARDYIETVRGTGYRFKEVG